MKDISLITQEYKDRLKIPIEGNPGTEFFTFSALKIADGYERIVIGKRGPYVEFNSKQILKNNLNVPKNCEYKLKNWWQNNIYYVEYRTIEDNIKVYFQKKLVDYADYKLNMYYISPFDLYVNGNVLITKLRNN
jgi:hypothetical protein